MTASIKSIRSLITLGLIAFAAMILYVAVADPFDQSTSLNFSYDQNTNIFTVYNLPVDNTNSPYNTQTAQYRIFINTGDGNYIDKTILSSDISSGAYQFSAPYYYGNAGTYNASLEVTEMYDDGEKPKKKNQSLAITTGSSNTNGAILNDWVSIKSTRNAVPGDGISFIVSVKNKECNLGGSADVQFTYDPNVLIPINNSAGTNVDVYQSNTAIQSSSSGVVNLRFNNMQKDEIRNVFIHFETKSGVAVNTVMSPAPTVNMTFNGSSSSKDEVTTCSTSATKVCTQAACVAEGHDPNFKVASLESICKNEKEIIYTVHFQNDGAGPVHSIMIEDEINPIFGNAPVITYLDDYLGGSYKSFDAYNASTRRYQIVLGGGGLKQLNLKGLAEPGYGIDFGDSDTRGWVKFSVAMPPNAFQSNGCNAIVNQAEIIFGCNPVVKTAPLVTPFMCLNCTDTCTTTIDTALVVNVTAPYGSGILAPDYPLSLLSNFDPGLYDKFRWYPSYGVGNPQSSTNPNPSIGTLQYTTYTLVASNSQTCGQDIFKFKFIQDCPLTIQLKSTSVLTLDCSNLTGGVIDAEVLSGTPPYKWQNCETNQAIHLTGLAPGKYYLGVTDANGCSASKWVEIKGPAPFIVDDKPGDCVANMTFINGSPTSYQWDTEPDGAPVPTPPNFSLQPYSQLSVTVTNSDGCTGTLVFKKGKKCGYIFNSLHWLTIGFIAVFAAVLVFAAYRWFRRTK